MTTKSFRTLSGKLVFLRPLRPSDAAEFIALAKRSRRFHRGIMSLAKNHEAFDGFLKKTRKQSSKTFAICRNLDGAIVGIINLSQIFYGPLQSAYLGYGLGVDFTGYGYAREAVQLILKFAFGTLGLHRIEANIQPDNIRSKHLVESVGFAMEGYSPRYLKIGGRWRDHERWAIMRENWKPRR